ERNLGGDERRNRDGDAHEEDSRRDDAAAADVEQTYALRDVGRIEERRRGLARADVRFVRIESVGQRLVVPAHDDVVALLTSVASCLIEDRARRGIPLERIELVSREIPSRRR